jgi:hypothetical protein
VCPECGRAVRGVDIRGAVDTAGIEVPELSAYVFLPCGHQAVTDGGP